MRAGAQRDAGATHEVVEFVHDHATRQPLPQQRDRGAGAVIGVHAGAPDLHEAARQRQDAREVEFVLGVVTARVCRPRVGEDAIAPTTMPLAWSRTSRCWQKGVVVIAFDARLGAVEARPISSTNTW